MYIAQMRWQGPCRTAVQDAVVARGGKTDAVLRSTTCNIHDALQAKSAELMNKQRLDELKVRPSHVLDRNLHNL
jgi:hypothetical protein